MTDSEHSRPGPTVPRRGGRMLAFYVAIGTVLALFIGGWFAWRPLKLRYAAREVERGARNPGGQTTRWCVDYCRERAAEGDPRAVEAVTDYALARVRQGMTVPGPEAPKWCVEHCLAAAAEGNASAMKVALRHLEFHILSAAAERRTGPVEELVGLGPAAAGTIRKLLLPTPSGPGPWFQMYLLNTLGRHQWALPLLVEVTQGRDKPMTFAAVKHIERITGRKFGDPIRDRYGAMARKEVAAWWESEGKAKYGAPNSVNGER